VFCFIESVLVYSGTIMRGADRLSFTYYRRFLSMAPLVNTRRS
jgi:hypothetical protein